MLMVDVVRNKRHFIFIGRVFTSRLRHGHTEANVLLVFLVWLFLASGAGDGRGTEDSGSLSNILFNNHSQVSVSIVYSNTFKPVCNNQPLILLVSPDFTSKA